MTRQNSQNHQSDIAADTSANSDARSASRGLPMARRWAYMAIVWERFWPLIVPFLGVVSVFLIISWFGLWALFGDIPRIGLLAVLAGGAVLALMPLRKFKLPNRAEIDTRIEKSNVLPHRPISTQSDVPAGSETDAGSILWREHQRRMAGHISALKPETPSPGIARFDPLGLRAGVLLVLFIAFAVASGQHIDRIMSAFLPHNAQLATAPRIDVWVSPPAYTNKPPLYLTGKSTTTLEGTDAPVQSDVARVHQVPEGSELVVRVVAGQSMVLRYGKIATLADLKNSDAKSPGSTSQTMVQSTRTGDNQEFRLKLSRSGTATLLNGQGKIEQWAFDIVPDQPPVIRFSSKPGRARNGALELAYQVQDDYNGVSAKAEIVPLQKLAKDARPLVAAPDFALPVQRRSLRATNKANSDKQAIITKTSRDLTHHPYAGGKVRLTLVATDAAGQEGRSETKTFILPARVFRKPLAQAIVEERRNLALDARRAPRVAVMIDAISGPASYDFIKSASVFTGLRVAYRGLKEARNDDELREILDLLWDIALDVEDGGLSLAERKLRDAQERLSEALENGASDKEIDRLMKDLRQAMAEYLNELRQQLAKSQPSPQQPGAQNRQTLSQRDLEKMMDRIENLAKSGSKDAARQLLSEMQQMMDNLQAGRHQRQRRSETGDQFGQQMNRLGEMMQQQQQLMDETFKMRQRNPRDGQQRQGEQNQQNSQQQNGQRQQGNQDQQPGGQRPMTAEEFAQAMKQLQQQQNALEKKLQQFMAEMQSQGQQPGQQPGKQLGKAGEAMNRAGKALGKGKGGPAIDQQGRALSALRKGAQQMMQQMQQQQSGERGGTESQGQQQNSKNDPLGRRQQRSGPQIGQSVKVPDEIDAQRARQILEAIRRRLADPARPKLELDYLDRLLRSR